MKLTAAYDRVGDWWAAWVEEIPGLTLGVDGWRKAAGRTAGISPVQLCPSGAAVIIAAPR